MNKSLVPSAYDFLSQQQKKLVDAYVDPENGFDQMTALEKAGYNRFSATKSSMNPFKHINVRRAISEKIRPAFDRTGITFEENFKFVAAIAYGDANELVEVKRCNCRYCYGKNNEYQWVEAEYRFELNNEIKKFKELKELPSSATQEEMEDMGFTPPSLEGGFGFDQWNDPSLSCPNCHGHGVEQVYIHPQYISHPLYAGAEVDKNGNIKINMRNQDHAIKLLSQLAGFLVEKVEIKEVVTADTLSEKRKRAIERKAERNAKAQK